MAKDECTLSSSNLAGGSYDDVTEDLVLEFQSGDSYLYRNVPQAVVSGLQAAGSAGAYFHRHIRDRYAYEMV